jgi:cytoskeleton protein RodZ
MPDQASNNVAELLSPGPGERLRAARLSMGFDLAKIASELHLTGRVVEALEADDYSDIGVRVFVRGYLRNYARIVGMPVDSILRQFDEKWPDDGVRHTVVRQSPSLPADGGPSRGLAGAFTWLLVIGLVALFLMWWRGYLDEIVPEQIRSTGADQVSPAAQALHEDDAAVLLPLDGQTESGDGSLLLPPPPADLPPEVETAVPVLQTPGPGLPGSGGIGVASESAAVAVPAPPVAAVTAAAEPPTGDGGTPLADGAKEIVMTFNAPCWVDVRDSERNFKLFGEMPKGTRKVLGGRPPYKLVIGNSRAVTITVNGEPFDLDRYAKGNVARFTLDP